MTIKLIILIVSSAFGAAIGELFGRHRKRRRQISDARIADAMAKRWGLERAPRETTNALKERIRRKLGVS